MSIDIDWAKLAGGPDGVTRAESIRAFIHDKFQQITLPRFIRSVHVHSFDFGGVPPEIEVKDICDPLPDFYEEEEEYSEDGDEDSEGRAPAPGSGSSSQVLKERQQEGARRTMGASESSLNRPPGLNRYGSLQTSAFRGSALSLADHAGTSLLPRISTPGIPGGTSNINYFHLPLSAGLSGTTTPLAAVAGAQLPGWPDYSHMRPTTPTNLRLRSATSMNSLTLTPQSNPDASTRPSSRHQHEAARRQSFVEADDGSSHGSIDGTPSPGPREASPEDIQIVAHVQYSGDIKMSLTAEILLDYPMPSFVGIPLKLNITGLTFDGVAILAHIRKRAHFCFLSPDDAETLIGGDSETNTSASDPQILRPAQRPLVGGLLEHIKVESEIGDRETGKQVLKNVGKVESFVLEQVRRIFEDEFVYPSFWTFLI